MNEISVYEIQEPSSTFYTPQNESSLLSRLDKMTKDVRLELEKQGFEQNRIHVERMLNMRFEGTDTALMVLPTKEDGNGKEEDFEAAFKRSYKAEFGFLLNTKRIIVDDVKVSPVSNVPRTVVKNVNRFVASVKHMTLLGSPFMRRSPNLHKNLSMAKHRLRLGKTSISTKSEG